ncbi:hypothetical protein ASG25_10610 [Rhizobium sp. Leaf384]|uniref:hypothetical protein n=1 Tax=Rhizobium sp. Leaf384 TaxID=1736358 RepID=UPI000713596A|nr:hypothetical protein [Rhizobium sp. Leaf384]KQS79029.1 hypothetical protein ASG25_10610 [Rhizobium sp. Leaf384]
MVGYIFGGNTGLNYEDLQNRRAAADALAKRIMGQQPKNVGEGIGALLQGAAAGIGRYQADKGLKKGRDEASAQFNDILSKITGQPVPSGGEVNASIPASGAASEIASSSPAYDVSSNGSTFTPFIETVKAGGLTNPFGLAAVAATGKAESGWSPENAARTWSDPSESGKPGTAGGIMSWRGPRYQALAATGDLSPEGQAKFFLSEDPNLIASLNKAQSVEEAQSLMNRAWAFKGYNRPGGEAARRMQTASAYLPQFQGSQQPTQVASLDPSAGMQSPQTAAQAIEAQAPLDGGSLSDEVAEYRSTPEYRAQFPGRQPASPAFDSSRFGDVVPPPQNGDGRAALQADLASQASAYAAPSPRASGALGEAAPVQVAEAAQVAPVASSQPAAPNPSQPQPMQAQPFQIDPQVLQFLSSPFADEGQKQSVRMMLQQQMQAAQQAQAEQQWRSRQDYANQQEQNDPLRQAQIAEAKARANALQTPTRPITAEERQAWGITDNRPYAMTANGPEAIGGNGQTINVGGQIEARKQAAEALGLKADDPRYMGYVLGGDMPKESQQNLTAIDKKAVLDALDQVQASKSATEQLQSIITPGENGQSLNDRAGSGAMADWQSWAARNDPTGFFDDAKGQATTELNNTVLNQALGSLKSIFGAAPTEGERQILMDMQASVDKTPAERKIIIDKAIALAQRRQQFNQDRADEIRGNTFYKPKPSDQPNVQTNPPRTADEATGMPPSRQDNSAVARPTTDEEFNALPPGSLYIDPDDGKQYRKP